MANNIKELEAKKADAARKNDVRLYRLMIEFVLTILAVFAGVMLGNINNQNQMPLHDAMFIVSLVTGILFAASAVYFVMGKKKADVSDYKVITRGGIFGNMAVLFLSCAHFYLFRDAEILIINLIAVALVYFTYNIFDGDITDYSVITAAGFILLEFSAISTIGTISSFASLLVKGSRVLAIVLPVAAIVYAIVRAQKKGKKTAIVPIILSSVLTAAGGVLNFLYPAFVVYAVFALVGVFLITVIAHTVKNM